MWRRADLKALTELVLAKVQALPEVTRTLTCIALSEGE